MRLYNDLVIIRVFGFNPRICKRCDQLNLVSPDGNTGFNPRICKRCDSRNRKSTGQASVSIHASVKDATYIRERCQCWIMVSIHASVKDATAC